MPKPSTRAAAVLGLLGLMPEIDALPHDGEMPGVNEWDSILG